MNESLEDRAEHLFKRLIELEPRERAAGLERSCAGDRALFQRVEELLRADELADDDHRDAGQLLPPGHAIANFRIVRLLGQGGMGAVYLAEQDYPRRCVALKFLSSRIVTPDLKARFQHEVDLLGRLQHPGIARVYEAGTCEEHGLQRPFFAMEYIEGVPLDLYAARHGLDVRERLGLIARLCDAVQHAQDRGVVHRDLKPANVLVDASGAPIVLDFGIGRVLDDEERRASWRTREGEVIGTLQYMSPEQALGRTHAVDGRTDVYALGVVLHELLTGRPVHDLAGLALPAAVRQIAETPARALSRWDTRFRGDLEIIVGKALALERERRYASPRELAADLRRHLDDEPIVARPPSRIERATRFVRHHRAFVFTTSIVVAVSIVAAVISFVAASRSDEARRDAELVLEALGTLLETITRDDTGLALAANGATRSLDRGARLRLIETIRNMEALAERGLQHRIPGFETLFLSLGIAYREGGRPHEALPVLERAVEHARREGTEDVLRRARNELVLVLARLGEPRRAVELGEQLVTDLTQAFGPENQRTLVARVNVANARMAFDGRRAIGELGDVRAAFARLRGERDSRVLQVDYLMGKGLHRWGRRNAAEELLVGLHSRCRATLGDGSLTEDVLFELGSLHLDSAPERAVLELHEVVRLSTQRRGEEHLDTFKARQQHAVALERAGRDEEARAAFASIVAELHEDPSTVPTLSEAEISLAMLEREAGHLEEALTLLQSARDRRVRQLPPFDERIYYAATLVWRHWLDVDRAVDVKRETRTYLEAVRTSAEPDPMQRIGVRVYHAMACLELAEFERAETFLREVLAHRLATRGDTDPQVASARMLLARALTGRRRFEEAETLLLQAWPRLETYLERVRDDCRRAFVVLYEAWEKPDQAAEWRQ
ncbi:MAG: serine/threonine protein kinase [Planctomycetes bacterium]|nr:serine/threonine protein kinase [Planctomycetota bacterium]